MWVHFAGYSNIVGFNFLVWVCVTTPANACWAVPSSSLDVGSDWYFSIRLPLILFISIMFPTYVLLLRIGVIMNGVRMIYLLNITGFCVSCAFIGIYITKYVYRVLFHLSSFSLSLSINHYQFFNSNFLFSSYLSHYPFFEIMVIPFHERGCKRKYKLIAKESSLYNSTNCIYERIL